MRFHRFATVLVILLSVLVLGAAKTSPLARAAQAIQPTRVKAPSPSSNPAGIALSPTNTPILNVKDYGAVGDGQADDTAAIQGALDAGVGKQVYVPAGTYKVRPLRERTATVLSLDRRAILVLAPESNGNLITVTAPGATISGSGTLNGNRAAQTTGAAVSIGGATGVTVRDVRIVNTVQYGIYAANAANLTISRVSVSGTGYVGIFAEATTGQLTNVVIENSRVDRSSEGGSIVEGGIVIHRTGTTASVSGVRISDNTVVMPKGPKAETVAIETLGGVQGAVVRNNTTSGAFIGISLANTTNGSVAGNTVSGASMYGIEIAASQATTVLTNTVQCAGYTQEGIVLDNAAPTDNTISGNTVSGCMSRGVALNRGSDRVSIESNKISQKAGYAIEILASTGAKVTNNVLDGTVSASKGLVGESSPDMTVTGNRVSRFTMRGVMLYRSDRAAISKNTISQTGGYAIHLMSTTGVSLAGNTVDGGTTALKGLVIDTSSNVTVAENVFSNFTQHGVLLYCVSPMVLDLITITQNAFYKTAVPYGTQLSGGATLGQVVFSGNTTV
jgi:parallel beta-helix repeat protein